MKYFLACFILISSVHSQEILVENFESGKLTWSEKTPLSKKTPEYTIGLEDGNHFLKAAPEKGVEGKIIYKRFSIDLKKTPKLKWRWRIHELPKTGTDCKKGLTDSAAGVYVYLQKGFLRRLLKYSFSACSTEKSWVSSPGSSWIWTTKIKVLHSGEPMEKWIEETVDIPKDFQEAYGSSAPERSDGIAVLTDGDSSNSTPKADYDDFVLLPAK